MNKIVLVTGGAGFIGSHTVDALLRKGYKVRLLDGLTKPVHLFGKPLYIPKEVEYIYGDVRNRSSWEKSLKGVDIVFHFAAYQDYLPNFSKFFDVNAKGTALLYETIVEKKLPIEKVILASSQAVYGEGLYRCKKGHAVLPSARETKDLENQKWEFFCPIHKSKITPDWVNEDMEVNPHNQYGISKYAQEKIALHLGKRYGIPSVAMRYSIVQGPRQSPYNFYSGALRIFVTHLLAGVAPIIYEDGNQIRDFVNIKDVVAANMLVLSKKEANYQVFNVGGGKKWKVIDFYYLACKVLGKNIAPFIPGTYRVGDTRHIFSSIKKIENLGLAISHSPKESIKDYALWLQTLPDFRKMIAKTQKTIKQRGILK